jgi:rSAM/selenodomain-associated transferase 2
MSAISTVIPVLDDAGPLERLLMQLRDGMTEAGVDIEIIVVDGGSTDGSVSVAERHANRVLRAQRGRATQLASGIASAKGDVIWMLHADCVVTAGPIRALADALRDERVRWGRFDVRLDAAGLLYRAIETGMNVRSCVSGVCTGDQGIFVRRGMLDAIGGVPLQPLMEDVELSKQLRRLGRPSCIHVPLTTSARRWQANGVVKTVLLMWMLRLQYFAGADPAALARRYYG